MSTIVIVLEGKGDSRADEVSVKLFDTEASAKKFCAKTTNLIARYWTSCVIVDEGEVIETYAND